MSNKLRNALIWGIILIIAGVLVTLQALNIISFGKLFVVPVVMIALAVFFHLKYFFGKRQNPGILIPGGIFLVYTVYFVLVAVGKADGWWPLFIIGPALGLLESYLMSRGGSGSIIASFILFALGDVLLLTQKTTVHGSLLWGIVLLVIGVAVVVTAFSGRARFSKSDDPNAHYTFDSTKDGENGPTVDAQYNDETQNKKDGDN